MHLESELSILQRAHTALAVDTEQEERGSSELWMTDPTSGLAHANQDDVPLGLVDSDTSERSATRVGFCKLR